MTTPALPQKNSRHLLAGSHLQHRGPSKGRISQHVRPANQETPTLARPCHPHARWQVTQRHSVWRACHWVQTHRKAYTPLQRRAQAGPQGGWHCASGFEALAADRSGWQYTTESAIKTAEQKREEQWEDKRARRRQRAETDTAPLDDNVFTCSNCNRVCRSRIGLYSHSRRCNSTTDRHLRAQTPLSPETDGCLYSRRDQSWSLRLDFETKLASSHDATSRRDQSHRVCRPLYNGVILADFHSSGKKPVIRD